MFNPSCKNLEKIGETKTAKGSVCKAIVVFCSFEHTQILVVSHMQAAVFLGLQDTTHIAQEANPRFFTRNPCVPRISIKEPSDGLSEAPCFIKSYITKYILCQKH